MKCLDFFKRKSWRWVGTVEGVCQWHDKGVHTHTVLVIWNLFERTDGKRRADLTGDLKWNDSAHVTSRQAAVRLWINGGPLPELKASATPPRPKPTLHIFPGGKGGGAA